MESRFASLPRVACLTLNQLPLLSGLQGLLIRTEGISAPIPRAIFIEKWGLACGEHGCSFWFHFARNKKDVRPPLNFSFCR